MSTQGANQDEVAAADAGEAEANPEKHSARSPCAGRLFVLCPGI